MKRCLNCGKEFIVCNKKGKRNHKYCSVQCYWDYRLKKLRGENIDKSKGS